MKPITTKNSGMTLLELLIAIAIIGILATIGVPAFNSTIANSRLTSSTNLLVGLINYARSEAITLGAQVTVSRNGNSWQAVSNGIKLKQVDLTPGKVSVVTDSGMENIVFEASGYRTLGSPAGNIGVCDDERSIGKQVVVSVVGSVSVEELSSC